MILAGASVVATMAVAAVAVPRLFDDSPREDSTSAAPTTTDHSTSSTSATPTAPPPECSGEWAGLVDVNEVPRYATIKAAVAARDRRGVLTVTDVATDKDSGITRATVVDAWGRSGSYGLFKYRGKWILSSGSGCAAY